MNILRNNEKISFRFIFAAPLISLILPFVGTILDRNSKCSLLPVVEFESFIVQAAAVIYFAIPLLAGIYGLIKLTGNKTLYIINKKKFYVLVVLTMFNILSPILLYYWFWASVILLFGFGCYELKIKF